MVHFLRKNSIFFAFTLVALALSTQQAVGQCTNTTQFPSAAQSLSPTNSTGTSQTITTAQFAGDYYQATTVLSGKQYRFSSSVSTDFLTIHSGSASGTVVASGITPLNYTTSATTDLFVHINTNSSCGTQSVSRTTTVQCMTCAGFDPCASIPTMTCGSPVTATPSGAGVWSPTTSCGFSTPGQEKIYSFTPATTGTYSLQVTAATGGYIDYFFKAASGGCVSTGWSCILDITSATTVSMGTLTAGTQYYILLDPEATGSYSHTFQINCPSAAPANNDCSGATTLTPGATCVPTSGTTVNATQSIAAITCATFTGTADDDVWYKFTATSTTHTVTVVGGGTFDAVLDVRSGACNGTNIGCADATFGGGTETATVSGLTVGATYYARVYSFGSLSSNQGTFTICVTTTAPANDDCSNAVTLTPAASCVTTSGSTVGATQSLAAITCATFTGTADDDVWYKFTATASSHTVTVVGGSGFDAVVDVRSGACNGTNIGCADATTSAGTETVNLTGLTVGATYLVRVYSFGSLSSNQGTFTICVTTTAPANDDCSNAVTLTPGATCVTTSGTTVGATQSLAAITCASFTGTADDDVWYKFTATASSHTVTVVGGSGFDAVVDVRSGACNGTNIGCADATTSAGTETVNLTGLTVGATYLVRVYSFGSLASNQGTFTICVTTPVVDPCTSITALTCGSSATATLSGAGAWNLSGTFPNNSCGFSTLGQEKVYSFTATVSGTYTVQVTSSTGNFIDYFFKAASGGCGSTGWTCIDDISVASSVTFGPLTAGTQYYILLDAESTSSVTHTFQINCPLAIPSCLAAPTAPANGASLCAPGPGTLSWPAAPGATSYEVYFGTTATPPLVTTTSSTSYSVGTLSAGTYFWQIRPANASGTASGCPVWSFTVDMIPPTISNCPNNQNVNRNAACVATLPNYTGVPTTSDNCPGTITVSQTPAPGTTLGGTVTVTLTATDASGNTATCSFTATPVDATPPTLSNCPGNQNVNRNAACVATLPNYTSVVTTSDNCPGTVTVSQTPAPGTTLNGTVTVTLTATDVAGNTVTCSFTATPVDVTPPTLSNCPNNQNVLRNASCVATLPNYAVVPTTSDNCPGTITVSQTPTPGTTLNGTVTVTLTATDAAGNTATCFFTATPVDQTPPSLSNCPGNQTASVNASCQGVLANYTGGVTAADNCPGVSAVTQSPAPGSTFTGTTIVTLSATDASGNTGTCTFTVQVADNTPPSIACNVGTLNPAADGNCQYVVQNLSGFATASDNCGTPTISQTPVVGTTLGLGTVTLTLRATDSNGNSATCSINLTVSDQTAPSITCPGTQTVAANASCQASLSNYAAAATATDNCTASPTKTQIPVAGTTLSLGTTLVTLRATDGAGLSSTCTFNVSVVDQTAPAITCPANITQGNTTGQCGANVSFGNATATDNCGSVTVVQIGGLSSGSFFAVGTTTETFRATDAANNSATCSFTVTVNDIQPPVITCPGTQTVAANASCQATLGNFAASATATDNCTGSPVKTQNPSAGTTLGLGTTTVTLQATDGAGLTGTCTFNVVVTDQTPPSITCPGAQTLAANASCQAALPGFTASAAATDNCTASPTKSQAPVAGTTLGLGVTVVTLQATDGAGLTGTCTFSVTVTDQSAPVIACPANITVNNTTNVCGATVSYTVTSSDNCAGTSSSLTLLSGQASGTVFPVGTTTVSYRATDPAGNSASCSFLVTVNDVQPPTITCPANVTVNNSPSTACSAVVTYATPTGTDNCASPAIALTAGLASGSTFPVGLTTNTWRATDASSNTATCSFTVRVNDVTLPAITCPANITVNNSPATACSAVVSYSTPTASDNCGISTVVLASGLASGSTFPVGITTNVWRATDVNTNSATCSFTVQVIDVTLPTITCPANITVNNSPAAACSAVVTYSTPTASDNCSISTVVLLSGLASGATFPVGLTTNVWRATDVNTNSATCSFTVRVNDATPPAITCPAGITQANDLGKCSAVVNYPTPTATDNCSVQSVLLQSGTASGGTFPVGATTNIWRATDASGNTASCSFIVTVNDTEKPKITCPNNINKSNDFTHCGATITNLGPTAVSDNCNIGPLSNNSPGFFPIGTTAVTWTILDNHGNSATCQQTVTIVDNEWPYITCPATVTQLTDEGNCNAVVNFAATATDNCPGLAIGYSTDPLSTFEIGYTSITATATDAAGHFVSCNFLVQVKTRVEVCNGLDDDCDGIVDDAEDWHQVIKTNVASGGPSDFYGLGVDISGGWAVVGSNEKSGGMPVGAAYILRRDPASPGGWKQVAKLTSPNSSAGDAFGVAVAIDSLGIVAVGAPEDDGAAPNAGAVFVYQNTHAAPDTWTLVKKVISGDPGAGDEFGRAVSLSLNRLLVGAALDDEKGVNAGAAYVFVQGQGGPNNWGQVAKLMAADGAADDHLGSSVAINDIRALAGAPGNDEKGQDAGAAYLFSRNEGGPNNWGLTAKLLGKNEHKAGDQFGASVAVSNLYALVGAPFNDLKAQDAGLVFAFYKNAGGNNKWKQWTYLFDYNASAGDHYGAGVSMDQEYAVVTADHDNPMGSNSGRGFVYLRLDDGWNLVNLINDTGGQSGDQFGTSVAISQRTIIIGVPHDRVGNDAEQGSAIIFEANCSDGPRSEGALALSGVPLAVRCFPVPFADALTIEVDAEAVDVSITVVNTLGQAVAEIYRGAVHGMTAFTWQAGRNEPGMYFLRVAAAGKVETKAVLLERP